MGCHTGAHRAQLGAGSHPGDQRGACRRCCSSWTARAARAWRPCCGACHRPACSSSARRTRLSQRPSTRWTSSSSAAAAPPSRPRRDTGRPALGSHRGGRYSTAPGVPHVCSRPARKPSATRLRASGGRGLGRALARPGGCLHVGFLDLSLISAVSGAVPCRPRYGRLEQQVRHVEGCTRSGRLACYQSCALSVFECTGAFFCQTVSGLFQCDASHLLDRHGSTRLAYQ